MNRLLNGNCNRNTAPNDAATKILSLMMSQQKHTSDYPSVTLPHTPQLQNNFHTYICERTTIHNGTCNISALPIGTCNRNIPSYDVCKKYIS